MSMAMSKITDKLYIGNLKAASDLQNLKKNVRTKVILANH
jgi:hypothetical protein